MSTAKKKLTTCEPKTAVAYARYSSAQQRDVSIEQQLRDIRAYAEREGYKIIYEYTDHAKSGFHNVERRTEFQAMLRAAETGSFDTVIAWKVDRFGRNRMESAVFKGQLADHGVKVVYAMEPIPEGAAGVLTEGMLESLAEWYSRNISENTKRGQHDNAIKCISNGHGPMGYETGPDNHFIINEAEAAIVRRVFTLYSCGYSVSDIVNTMNREGVLTKKGKPYQRSTIISMLRNDSYAGVYHYAGVRVPGGMPAIIDADLWDRCQMMRKKTHQIHIDSPDGYLLSGKCICGLCGSKIYGNYTGNSNITKNGKRFKYYYYSCRGRKEGNHCRMPYRQKETIEGPIVDLIVSKVIKGKLLDQFTEMIVEALDIQREESTVMVLQRELDDVSRRINNIIQAISEGIWTKQTAAMLDDLNARADDLKAKISYHKAAEGKQITDHRVRFILHKVADGLEADPEYLKTLIDTLVNSVTVYENWARVVINAAENVQKIPSDELPPLDQLPDLTHFDKCTNWGPKLVTVEKYPVIIFKIAI